MTDELQTLAEANPVDRDRVDVPETLRARALARSRRSRRSLTPPARRWVPAVAVALIAVMAVTFAVDRSGSVDLAERAYAAVSSPGITHWKISITASRGGSTVSRQTEEGWSDGRVTRTVLSSEDGRGSTSVTERRVSGDDEQHRVDGGPVQTGPRPRTDLDLTLPGPDPLSAFREAYRAGRLVALDDTRFSVRTSGPGSPVELVYDVDGKSGVPRTLTQRSLDDGVPFEVTRRFELFEALPADETSRQQLELRGG
jgi:hypothetical protein